MQRSKFELTSKSKLYNCLPDVAISSQLSTLKNLWDSPSNDKLLQAMERWM